MGKQESIAVGFDDIVSIIVRNLRESVPESGSNIVFDFNVDTTLLGQGGILDSLGLVSLIVSLEQAIEDECGVSISLADERAMSETRSPYRTVGSLAEYGARLVMEKT
jgi:D-alanine--poly(phosphoribitol) ligase subunit 2